MRKKVLHNENLRIGDSLGAGMDGWLGRQSG